MSNTITLTAEQMADLNNGKSIVIEPPKPNIKQWEPKGGIFWITDTGKVQNGQPDKNTASMGNEFQTLQQAEEEAVERRKRARLVAYRNEFCPDYKPDWSDYNTTKYSVHRNVKNKRYEKTLNTFCTMVGAVYFPREVVEVLLLKLNSGEVVL